MPDEKSNKEDIKKDKEPEVTEEDSDSGEALPSIWSPYVGVAIGILALYIFSDSREVHILVKALLILGGIAFLIVFLTGAKRNKSEDTDATEELDTRVERKTSSKSSVKKSEAKVTNRVKMPNPTPAPRQEVPTPSAEPKESERPKAEDVKTTAMTESDFEDFF